jgi:hypothetical protein
MIKVLLIIAIAMLANCTNPDGANRVLYKNGYTDIVITGYQWGMCGQDDTYATGFTAKSPAGIQVKGCVCQGMFFMGSTIRFK